MIRRTHFGAYDRNLVTPILTKLIVRRWYLAGMRGFRLDKDGNPFPTRTLFNADPITLVHYPLARSLVLGVVYAMCPKAKVPWPSQSSMMMT